VQDIPYLAVFIWHSHMNLNYLNSGQYNFWKASCILQM